MVVFTSYNMHTSGIVYLPAIHHLPFPSLPLQISPPVPSCGSSHSGCSRSPNTTTWCHGRTRRRDSFDSTMPRPLLPCGGNTEIVPQCPMTKLHEHFDTTTKETFWSRLEAGSPIALLRGSASSTWVMFRTLWCSICVLSLACVSCMYVLVITCHFTLTWKMYFSTTSVLTLSVLF